MYAEESFLRNKYVVSWPRYPTPFTHTEISFPCSQQFTIGPYHE